MYPDDGLDEQTLMKNADTAMYYAKAEGKNNYRFYSSDIQIQTSERMDIEKNLRFALERNELSLHYQAKVDVNTGAVTGVEALLRWNNKALGSVAPLQFIPIAEETGMILPIGHWVLKTACAQNVAWQRQGLPAICMAVNLSLRQVLDNQLIADIRAVLRETGLAPELLELEITESMIMSNPAHIIAILTEIKRIGVKLSIDDFGTGYSSLSKLKEFPVDTLKIDRSFIHNLPDNDQDKAITQAILVMGESLSLNVIAEGVETEAQLNFLKEQFCGQMQGFYFNKPMEPDSFAAFLREQPTLFPSDPTDEKPLGGS
jgi:EAL domain-containing protein (putative c-di-GMP-specific phosphodiesterase class I)